MPNAPDHHQPTARPQPAGQPGYERQFSGWLFGCWSYPGSHAIHGRLVGPAGEVFGRADGDTIQAGSFTLVWRGDYVVDRTPDRSTGWLFIEPRSGPPSIRDGFDPLTDPRLRPS